MGLKDAIAERILRSLPTKAVWLEAAMRRGSKGNAKDTHGQLKRYAHVPDVFDLEDWRMAITAATDPERPDRSQLADIYKGCELDNHLMTVIENRILKLQGSPFKLVDQNQEPDEEAVKLMRKMWFLEFIKHATNSIFFGTQLLEIKKLNDKMELMEVNAFPQANFIPEKKQILLDAAKRTDGIQYDKGAYSNYLLQIGKDRQLGVMEKLCIAVLFKKKAAGSWLDYIEKYGVPPRWVITDREDDERFEELYSMMKDMIGNSFAVLRGQEKIEIMQPPGTDAHEVFDKFLDRMDTGITKRIAGATGTVDEKSFVGAAKVHQDTFNDRHWGDKFFIQFLINEELIPRLVKLSPVYAPLEKLSFEWDETENLTLEKQVDLIVKMAEQFELDPEEVKKMTGFAVIRQKSSGNSSLPGGGSEKK